MTNDNLLSTNEAAQLLGITRTQVTRLCKAGVLVSQRIGHTLAITRDSIEYAADNRPAIGRPKKDKHAVTVRALRSKGYLGLARDVRDALTDKDDIGRPENRCVGCGCDLDDQIGGLEDFCADCTDEDNDD
jgi:excisionase family DNA binding protein